ncbi:anti-sigma factor [Gordonia paraffinivorans]|uniref:anti-sigma factor n=1 Tax=Gordonia paraffinivorans TaxID=175628 RepID=UPI003FCC772B
MSEHLDPEAAELLELAPVVGLDAASDDELRDIEARLAAADDEVRELFARQVRATREAMAAVSAVTATPAPPSLRGRVLAAAQAEAGLTGPRPAAADAPPLPPIGAVEAASMGRPTGGSPAIGSLDDVRPADLASRRSRPSQRLTFLTAAAVAAVAIGAVGWAVGLSAADDPAAPPPTASPAERVFSAEDLRSTSAQVATGSATVYLAPSADTAVLVMNSVPPPAPGTVYQMWLVGPAGTRSAGTMTADDVEPVTTAVLSGINAVDALAFTVEPPGGSEHPTSAPVAQLTLG